MIMLMSCRIPHIVAKVGLGYLLIFGLTYMVFLYRKSEVIITDVRFLPSDCINVEQSMHSICRCPRSREPMLVPHYQKDSACSDHATARGPGQKVVAYSFYGTVNSRYFVGTEVNIKKVAEFYPGWIMRFYTNSNLTDPKEANVLCNLWCNYTHFDVCHVNQLPTPLCNQSEIFGMIWRFFVLGDPLVDRFLIRDLDSEIYQREVDAVQEWIKSGKAWHVMRDHVNHHLPILGGMWGARNVDLNVTIAMRKEMIRRGKYWHVNYDQTLLAQIVWPYAKQDMLQHDSYNCLKFFNQTNAWPTKRIGDNFVGLDFPWEGKRYPKNICPISCRPKEHFDWIFC